MNSDSENTKTDIKGYVLYCVAIIVFLTFKVAQVLPWNEDGKVLGLNYNYVVYFCVIVFAFLSFFVIRSISLRVNKNIPDRILSFFYIMLAIISILFLYVAYDKEIEYSYAGLEGWHGFIREHTKHLPFTLFMLVAILLIGSFTKKKITVSTKIKWLYSIAAAFLGAIFVYAPNLYKNGGAWKLWHVHAYTNSIVNIMNLHPYDDSTASIYGHYGLIYYPFVRLLGNNYKAIAITIALFAFITYICVSYVLINMVKDDSIYILSILAILGIGISFMGEGQYYQILPHRCLFPALTLALITWHIRHQEREKLYWALKLICGILSVIFNLETGMVCLVTLSFVSFVEKKDKRVASFFAQGLYMMLCVISSYLIVNAYNILVGGEWNGKRTFIFPIASDGYNMFKLLRVEITNPISGYFIQIVFLLLGFGVALVKYHDKNEPRNYRERHLTVMSIAMCGIGVFTYFIDRPAASCMAIAHIQFVMILASYSDAFYETELKKEFIFNNPEKVFKTTTVSIAFLLIAWLALENLMTIGYVVDDRNRTVWEQASLEEDIKDFREWRKEGAIAFGIGIPELYYMIGEDTGIALSDWSGTINGHGYDKLREMLTAEDDVIVTSELYNYDDRVHEMLAEYTISNTFTGNNFECYYMTRNCIVD
ncbi:MAG: hypothetical protein K6G69_02355 [Lachnospiraceae bacterium]|nr:hypothetical protein [Lachnospiraceae bacterium]